MNRTVILLWNVPLFSDIFHVLFSVFWLWCSYLCSYLYLSYLGLLFFWNLYIYFFKDYFVLFPQFFPSKIPLIYLFIFLMWSWKITKVVLFLVFFYVLHIELFLLLCLQVHWLFRHLHSTIEPSQWGFVVVLVIFTQSTCLKNNTLLEYSWHTIGCTYLKCTV